MLYWRWCALIFLPLCLFSQPDQVKRRIDWGIGVQVNSGLGLFQYGNLQKDLDIPEALNQDSIKFFMNSLTTTYAFTGEFFFFERMLLYGMYQMDFSDASETARGQAKVNSTLYGGGIGFAVLNNGHFYLAPRVGFLTGNSRLRLFNYATEPIRFGDTYVNNNDKIYYTAPVSVVDVGVVVRHPIASIKGVVVGGALGAMIPVGTSEWELESSGQKVQNVEKYKLNAYYLRVSVGFGYYNTKAVSIEPPIRKEEHIEIGNSTDSSLDKKELKKKKKRKGGEEIYFE